MKNKNEENINSVVATRIKALRKEFGITQNDLAQKLNLSRQAISKIEQGRVALTFDNARLIAEIYGVSTDWLCGRSDFMNYSPEALIKFVKYKKRKAMRFETRTKEVDDDPYVDIMINYELHTYLMSMAIAEEYQDNKKVYESLVKTAEREFLESVKYASKDKNDLYCMHPLLLVERENLGIEHQIDTNH